MHAHTHTHTSNTHSHHDERDDAHNNDDDNEREPRCDEPRQDLANDGLVLDRIERTRRVAHEAAEAQ